jgi:hypothetical protein
MSSIVSIASIKADLTMHRWMTVLGAVLQLS